MGAAGGAAWRLGGRASRGEVRGWSRVGGGGVGLVVRLVKIEADGENQSIDVATITRPDDLAEIAHLGLTLAEGKRLLAALQQQIVAAQARNHAVRRPDCRRCGEICHVKDYRDHAIVT